MLKINGHWWDNEENQERDEATDSGILENEANKIDRIDVCRSYGFNSRYETDPATKPHSIKWRAKENKSTLVLKKTRNKIYM